MELLRPVLRDYAWGSRTAIPGLLGQPPADAPVAEAWFGAHGTGSALLPDGQTLQQAISQDPVAALGEDVVARFGPELPFLTKFIAPAHPLSLQVHPSQQQAALGWVREERAGTPLDAAHRTYKDPNHKPEMVYALTPFEALSGFRTTRRAREVVRGLRAPLIDGAVRRLEHGSSVQGMRAAFEYVLLGARDRDADVDAVVEQVAERVDAGASPSEHTDSFVLRIAEHFPGDRGIVAALLLNPVTLHAGEALFVPAGAVHAYLSGLAVEIMASSDNVIRAGLTPKHIDTRGLVDIVDVQPAPPIRIAPESLNAHTRVFCAPVEDFEFVVIDVSDQSVGFGEYGPRIAVALDGSPTVTAASAGSTSGPITLSPGQAVFLAHGEAGEASGTGRIGLTRIP